MEGLLELGGTWLAKAYVLYGFFFLFLPTATFANVAVLGAVVWAAISHARGRQPWPYVPGSVRRWVRLAVEIVFGLARVGSSLIPAGADSRNDRR